MIFYLYLAVILLLLSFTKYARNKVVYTLVCVALFFIAAYREIGVGTDSVMYYYLYYLFVNNESYVLSTTGYRLLEFSWLFLLKLFRTELDYRSLLVFLELLIAIPLFYAIYRKSKWPLFSIYLYVALYFFGMSMNLMRQSIAMSLLVFSIPLLMDGKNKYYWLMMFLSMSLHASSLVAFGVVWLVQKLELNFDKKLKYALLIIGSFIVGMFFTYMFQKILAPVVSLLDFGNYSIYVNQDIVEKRNLFSNLGLNLMALFLLYKNPQNNSLFFKIYIIGLISSNFIGGLGAFAGRITLYFTIMQIFVFPDFICSFPSMVKRRLYTAIIVIYSFSIYYYSLDANSGEIIPYINIFL